ncbi:MAG: hypothetical protein HND58_00305 [Planctomycetota bacterium]|nr:MAG: hypothetical protein HND58_00305 [Planctomycetota bacterium]
MPQFLVLYSPPRPTFATDATEAEQDTIAAHFGYLERARDAGTLILAGRTLDEPPLGIGIFEAPSENAARAFVEADPAVRNRLFTADVRPCCVALRGRGSVG